MSGRTTTVGAALWGLAILGVASLAGCGSSDECGTDGDCKGDRVCNDGVCESPGSGSGGSGSGGGSSGGSGPAHDCIETTFQITNWSGATSSNSLYTGTSWNLEDCTEIQSDAITITVRCPVGVFGDARLISEGCGVLGIAAPGNILSDVGAAPPAGLDPCAGKTVDQTTIVCYQSCQRDLEFTITSGWCP